MCKLLFKKIFSDTMDAAMMNFMQNIFYNSSTSCWRFMAKLTCIAHWISLLSHKSLASYVCYNYYKPQPLPMLTITSHNITECSRCTAVWQCNKSCIGTIVSVEPCREGSQFNELCLFYGKSVWGGIIIVLLSILYAGSESSERRH